MRSSQNIKIAYSYLVADFLHLGHIGFLEKAKSYCDRLVVGILSDEATMEKKLKPIFGLAERIRIAEALACIDMVVVQYQYSPLENVKVIRPDILIESDSHKEMPANDYVKSYGGEVKIIPYLRCQSSTAIKKKVIEQYEENKEK